MINVRFVITFRRILTGRGLNLGVGHFVKIYFTHVFVYCYVILQLKKGKEQSLLKNETKQILIPKEKIDNTLAIFIS